MSTTAIQQEQNPVLNDEQNTNFVKNEKSAANEVNPIKQDEQALENSKKEHDEPKQNQQMPDQSGTSLTEKNNPNSQDEKLPEPQPHKDPENSNPDASHQNEHNLTLEQQPKEPREDLHKEEQPQTHSVNQEEKTLEENKDPSTIQNSESESPKDDDKKPNEPSHPDPIESNSPKNENLQSDNVNNNKTDEEEDKLDVQPEQPANEDLHNPENVNNNKTGEEGDKLDIQPEQPTEKDLNNHDQNNETKEENQQGTNDNNENELEEKPLSQAPLPEQTQTNPQEELTQNIDSIFNFFSLTKNNIIESSEETVAKLAEVISKSKLGSLIQGNDYVPVITSDYISQQEKTEPAPNSTTKRKSSQNESKKLRNQSIENPLQTIKSPKKTNIPNKNTPVADSKILANDKSLTKLQAKQPEAKNRNEIEEQIRLHKIQEIIKQKKALEMKLGALSDQLVELQKPEFSNSPNRSKSKPKESREEFLDRKKKAIEFAKKMKEEQKAIEIRTDQRREARQVLVNKEIEALQQLANKKYERKKIMDYIKGQSEVVDKKDQLKVNKYGLSSLEEKKQELKNKREFEKDLDTDFVNTRDPSEHDQHKLTSKSSSKKLYKSPLLPQVLANDAEQKKIESEKIAKRKALHDKRVDYGRGVKDIFLPKVQSKFEARKQKMGVYKSQQVDTYLLRSGKDGLYGYLDRMKNEFEGVNHPKSKKKPSKYRQEPNEDDFDRPPTEFADGEEQNANVAYGKQLVYELQDNWNLADGTLSNRVMSNKNQDLKKNLSPRNPEVNAKYTIKHKKEKDLMIDGDHLSDTEQSYRAAKRSELQYEDDEDY